MIFEDLEKKNEFIKINIIKNILEQNKMNKYFDCRENIIRQELNSISILLNNAQKNLIVEKINNLNISFKIIPLKYQLYKIAVMLKNNSLINYYDIEYYKKKYEVKWNNLCN